MSVSLNSTSDTYAIDYAGVPLHCYIFNNRDYPPNRHGLGVRSGSERDVKRLEKVCHDLRFKTEVFLDQTSSEVRAIIKDISTRDYTNTGGVIVFLMSHGNKSSLFFIDGQTLYLNEFIEPFKSTKTLQDKPKLFFVQACRGENFMSSHDQRGSACVNDDQEEENTIPIEADFLYAYSTIEGFYSFIDPESGTWYIQTLCDVIEKYKTTKDVTLILVEVNDIIAQRETNKNQKMMHTCTNQLRKLFYFAKQENQKMKQGLMRYLFCSILILLVLLLLGQQQISKHI